MPIQTSRRSFLKGAAVSGAAMFVGLRPDGTYAAANSPIDINPFLRISPDGVVHVIVKHFEMGQGTTTGLATLVAEELDADWDTLAVEFAPANSTVYKNLLFGSQGTGGSTAIANSWMQYRRAGAMARTLLVNAASQRWGVDPADITIESGVLTAAGNTAHFGELVAEAVQLTPDFQPKLKEPSEYRLFGNESVLRKDSTSKTDGTAKFAIDVKLPGMVTAMIVRSPRFGGKLTSFDASAAAEIAGFVDAKALPTGAGVVVYARNTWAAMQARDAVTAEWEFSEAENRSTDALIEYHKGLLDTATYQVRRNGDPEMTKAALAAAVITVEAEFILPNLAHAPMETLNCVIEPTESGVRLHDGCQFPGITQPTVAAVLGLPPENVEINTVYAGGSFGRRATPTSDYHVEAALAFDLLGRETPVHLMWTREDDIKGGYYRPMAAHRATIGMTDDRIVAWDHRIAVKSILKGTPFESALVHDGIDNASVEGLANTPYDIPAMSVGLTDAESQIPVLWWRAVGHTHTAFALESLMDMAAEAAGQDPIDFRLTMLGGPLADHQRMSGVLKLAAEKAGWGTATAPGQGRGVAVHKSFNSFVALVAEVSVSGSTVTIDRVTCAVDCGVAINPDVIRAQMEGGIGYGLGAVMRNQITLTDGEVDQSNFPDYEPLRMSDMPKIEVHIVASDVPPTGVGEPGTPPAGPALANAIYAATGKRITQLPMTEAGIDFA